MAETVSIAKGERVPLSKFQNLDVVRIELAWEKRQTDGPDFDLDVSVFLLGQDGKLAKTNGSQAVNFVFYNHRESPNKAVWRGADSLTGGKEEAWFEPSKALPEVQEVAFIFTMHEAEVRNQNFGQIKDARVSFFNDKTGELLVTFDLDEDYSAQTAMHAVSFDRRQEGFRLRAIGEGSRNGLSFFMKQYGLQAG